MNKIMAITNEKYRGVKNEKTNQKCIYIRYGWSGC